MHKLLICNPKLVIKFTSLIAFFYLINKVPIIYLILQSFITKNLNVLITNFQTYPTSLQKPFLKSPNKLSHSNYCYNSKSPQSDL